MERTVKKLSWREQQLLTIISKQDGRLLTNDIYVPANMAKATALKHLAVLEAKGLIYSEYLGPSKLWWCVEYCPICGDIMKHKYVSICTSCTRKKEMDE